MRKQFIIILLALLAIFGLMVSCKNEVPNAGFGEELVSISFREDLARGLTATLEGFDKDHLYWAYAAQKADGSHLISGQTDNYGLDNEVKVWVRTDGYNKPVEGLGTTGTSGYEAYKVSGFSQGYWNFRLYAYKGVLGDNPATEAEETDYVTDYVLVYQGETKNALLKSDSVNAQGSHMVSVTVDPVKSEGNGTLVFLTDKLHAAAERISMNTVNSAIYGEHYTVKVLSILSMEDYPVEYVDVAGAKIHEATDSQDGEYSLPAGSYKVTVAFTNDADNPVVNYAKGTIVATVYSNLKTTISGDLTEAMTYAEFDGILNPDLVTVTASSEAIDYDSLNPSTQVSFSSTGTAKAVTATTTKAVTNQIIQEIAATNGTNMTEYDQSLKLTLNVETVESTATTATYEIGMTAELTSTKLSDQSTTKTTSDVSNVDNYVTIDLQLQPGLTIVSVLHSGEPMTESPVLDPTADTGSGIFRYIQATGVLTIMTKSFSPFDISYTAPGEENYVAQVGTLKFLTLSDAIAKAGSNDTVTLLRSITLTADVDFDVYAGILDLGGYTITGNVTASKYGATVRNGSITGTLTAAGNSALIKDLTVAGKIITGGTGAVLENCTVIGADDYAVEVTAGNASIKSGTYKASASGKILNGAILVEDGNFKGILAPINAEGVVLTGGTYEADETAYVASGYECVEVSTGVFKVRKAVEAENRTTGVGYYYLQDAINEASSGNVIGIRRDIDTNDSIVIPEGKSISIDLTDVIDEFEIPRTIRSRAAKVIENNGSLTLKGEGSVLGIAEGNVLFNNGTGATLVITGGTYSADPEAFVFDGLYAHDNGNGTWTVTAIPEGKKVRNGNYFYDLLSEALAASELSDGDNILLLGDITDSVAIKNIKNLTIDLNGYKFTATGTNDAVKISECENVTVKNGTIESAGHVFKIGDHQRTIVKWKYADQVPMYGYHPLMPAKNVTLENISAVATGSKTLFYFTNIEDDLTRADESNRVDNDLYGKYVYKTGYQTQEQSDYKKYDEVFTACSDKDSVTIIGGSYSSNGALFANMRRSEDRDDELKGQWYTDVVFAESGSFSSDEIGRFLAEGKYLVSYEEGLYTVVDQKPTSYTAKLNDVYYCFEGGADAAIALADFGETVYIYENAATEKRFGQDDVLTVVYEEEGISYTGAKPMHDLVGYEVIESVEDSAHTFSVKFVPVAAVYATSRNGSWANATKVGEYATLQAAFDALSNDYTVVIMKDVTVGDETTYKYGGANYKCAVGYATRSTVDFNGHMITYTGTGACIVSSQQTGYLYFKDSSAGKTGGITATGTGYCVRLENAKSDYDYFQSGNYIAEKYALYLNGGTGITISGGYYESKTTSAVYGKGWKVTTLDITGGSFKSKAGSKDISSPADGSISGGTFSYNWNNDSSKLASGKTCIENEDGTWTVK